ncbi:hypothetical protein Q1695_006346 [Nippostrongylus brasiliensis]|nr:hypothetical protein Q1695_006346 [Nippostrongylus brasiliensis]
MSSNNTEEHKFVSPVSRTAVENVDKEQADNENTRAKEIEAAKKETPVAVRTRRHFQQELHMSSPSDAQLSPCTTKLFARGGRKMTNGPTAILRNKQHNAIPFNMNE